MNWQGSKPCSKRTGPGLPGPVRFVFCDLTSRNWRKPIASASGGGLAVPQSDCALAQSGL